MTEVRGSGLVCTHQWDPQDSSGVALLSDLCGPSGIIETMAGELQLPGRLVMVIRGARERSRPGTRLARCLSFRPPGSRTIGSQTDLYSSFADALVAPPQKKARSPSNVEFRPTVAQCSVRTCASVQRHVPPKRHVQICQGRQAVRYTSVSPHCCLSIALHYSISRLPSPVFRFPSSVLDLDGYLRTCP